MKKRGLLLFVGVLLFCLSALVACNQEKLPSPINIRLTEVNEEQMLMWDEVPYSTGGYSVEINGKQFHAELNEFSLSGYVSGVYEIRLRALTIDKNYYVNSNWSKVHEIELQIESGVQYTLINSGTEYEVSKIGTASGEVVIFNTYKGKPITSIGEAAFSGLGSSKITSIVLGENITKIGDAAFAGCGRLTTVVIKGNLKTIGNRAFEKCRALTTISLPNSVTSIGDRAFEGCHALASIKIPEKITVLPISVFSECLNLSNVELPDALTTISETAFYKTTNLENITLPNGVINIGINAFNSSALKSISLGNSLEVIGLGAFYNCKSLSSITIPDTVTNIGYGAFQDTAIWNSTEKTPGVVYADNWVVGYTNTEVENVTITDGTIGIAEYAFDGMKALATISIPSSVKYIGNSAFINTALWKSYAVNKLVYADNWLVGHTFNFDPKDLYDGVPVTDIVLPNNVAGISDYAFAWLLLPISMRINDGAKTIGAYAFYGCEYLVDIQIPNSVNYIGRAALAYCTSLTTVELPRGLTRIDELFRASYRLTQVIIPSTLKILGDYSFYACSYLSSIKTHDDQLVPNTFALPNGLVTIGINALSNASRSADIADMNIIVPDTVTSIGAGAFAAITELRSIVIPAGVTVIPDELFYACSNLATIDIKGEITSIGNGAFMGCYAITEMEIPETVTFIGERAFEKCYFLKSVVIPEGITYLSQYLFMECLQLVDVTLPSTLKTIGKYAFYSCIGLETISLPAGLVSINSYAFANCTGLKSLTLSKALPGIDNSVFHGCENVNFDSGLYDSRMTIYSDDYMRPINWSVHWNSSMLPVIWNCTLSEDKTYVVSFHNKKDSITNYFEGLGNQISGPERAGYEFAGWSLTKGSVIPMYTNVLDVPEDATVYAIWIPKE